MERGEIGPWRIGARPAGRGIAGIVLERQREVSAAVGGERGGELGLLGQGERKLGGLEHGGIVEPPLHEVSGFDAREQAGRLAGFGDGLPAIRHRHPAECIHQLHFALEHRERGHSTRDADQKLRPLRRASRARCFHRQRHGTAAAREIHLPFEQAQRGGIRSGVVGENLQLGTVAQIDVLPVLQSHGRASEVQRAQRVVKTQPLIGRRNDRGVTSGDVFDAVFLVDHLPGLVRADELLGRSGGRDGGREPANTKCDQPSAAGSLHGAERRG